MEFGSLPWAVVNAIDRACDEYEEEWRSGGNPRIEVYLEHAPEPNRPPLLKALLLLEMELREKGGERLDMSDYLERFSNYTTVIHSAFDTPPRTRPASPKPSLGVPRENGADEVFVPPPTTLASAETVQEHAWGASRTDPTTTVTAGPGSPTVAGPPPPQSYGRYRVIRLLGEGGFGKVYLARDDELGRHVAVKVLRPNILRRPGRLESLLAEAKLAAKLKHPAIVTVYDAGRQGADGAFIVLEYIEGRTLAEELRLDRPTPLRLAEVMTRVAEGVHHAHDAGHVHSDLKPSNILIDGRGLPHVTDFGLAVSEDPHPVRFAEVAGTPAYMAPEQVRGETHRFDRATDVWALGVVLYLGLTRRPPFGGKSQAEIFDAILTRDPRPLRHIDETIPRELERICLRCLSKRMTDRYQKVADLAEELKGWINAALTPTITSEDEATELSPRSSAGLVAPKGLRPFGIDDAHFFLNLLPGPKGPDGLPESVRFWKTRIEAVDDEKAFSVGLLYGPSGGGKSSFVRAGLLPNLERSVHPLYVEASLSGTEARLLAVVKQIAPSLAPDSTLPGAVAALREGVAGAPDGKILLVLDQFEQWLQGHPDEPAAELIQALRQCDGRRVQALVLVRDDFWMAVTRFFRALEVRLVEGVNSAAVELFDVRHARNVLTEFGRACGCLPTDENEVEGDAARFLDQAVAGLAGTDERVIPVRLSLFAEVVRHRAWTPATLQALGGVAGIGVKFLEEAFDSPTAPPTYRLHRRAAQAVLQALLPAPTSVLRGKLRSSDELRAAAVQADRGSDFADLIRVLDTELRMVTLADRSAAAGEVAGGVVASADPTGSYYQLTHDFLVSPIRQWLDKEERATRPGRARLRLASVAAAWIDRPEPRHLPSPLEWLSIISYTRPGSWSAEERQVMRAATHHYVVRGLAAWILIAAIAAMGLTMRERVVASSRLESAINADYPNLPSLITALEPYRSRVIDDLERRTFDLKSRERNRDVAKIILHHFAPDRDRAASLRNRLLVAAPDELNVIRGTLAEHPDLSGSDLLWPVADDANTEHGKRLRAACALAQLDPKHANWATVGPVAARALLDEDRSGVPRWMELFGPVTHHLEPTLNDLLSDQDLAPVAAEALAAALGRRAASTELADLSRKAARTELAELVANAPPKAFNAPFHALQQLDDRDESIRALERVLQEEIAATKDQAEKERIARRQANAAVALAGLGKPDPIWPRLRHNDDPRVRGLLIDRLARLDASPKPLVARLDVPEVDPLERQALLMAVAELVDMNPSRFIPAAPSELVESASRLYRLDPHPGVHSAARLLLERLHRSSVVASADKEFPIRLEPARGQGWFMGPNGHTFAVRESLEGWVGSPDTEIRRGSTETRHYRRIGRSLAVSTSEVSTAQYRNYFPEHREFGRLGAGPDHPAHGVSWYKAARYCNRLSKAAGIPPDQWCYPEEIVSGMILSADAVERSGFRLPTEAEWELLCRAGTLTARPFGESDELLPRYACTWIDSFDGLIEVGKRLPNQLGLFDVLGNTWEWCHDGPDPLRPKEFPVYPEGSPDQPAGDPQCSAHLVGIEGGDGSGVHSSRLTRGGAFDYAPSKARSAMRDRAPVNETQDYLGLRIVRTLPAR